MKVIIEIQKPFSMGEIYEVVEPGCLGYPDSLFRNGGNADSSEMGFRFSDASEADTVAGRLKEAFPDANVRLEAIE